jgi:molybdopterin-guanine dinucleotide biosynthesis protein A
MGTDKALLRIGEQTLLERTLRTAAASVPKVVIVGAREHYGGFGETIEDIYRECGPLGGIHAALSATQTDLNLVLSVDMPAMTSDFLSWLVIEANKSKELVIVPEALGGLQPLCAVYRRPLRALAEQALKNGDYKIGHMFSLAPTRYISQKEIVAASFSPELFHNVNTREDYEAMLHDAELSKASSHG